MEERGKHVRAHLREPRARAGIWVSNSLCAPSIIVGIYDYYAHADFARARRRVAVALSLSSSSSGATRRDATIQLSLSPRSIFPARTSEVSGKPRGCAAAYRRILRKTNLLLSLLLLMFLFLFSQTRH